MSLLLLGGGLPRIPLIRPGLISPRLSFARAQTGGATSSYIAADGTTIVSDVPADRPRFNGPSLRALIEGQRTNVLVNSATLSTQSVSVTAGTYTLSFRGTGSVTLSGAGSGTLAGSGATTRVQLAVTVTTGTLTLTVTGSVTTAQLEVGPFASSYIPTDATAKTRGADLVSASLAALGIPASGACTLLWSGKIGRVASGQFQTVAHIDDGSANNRALLRNDNTSLTLWRVTGGAASSAVIGPISSDTMFRCGMSLDGSGRVAASLDGGSVSAVTGAPTSGFTMLRAGTDNAGLQALFGDVGRLDLIPCAISDTRLQAEVAAMPLLY